MMRRTSSRPTAGRHAGVLRRACACGTNAGGGTCSSCEKRGELRRHADGAAQTSTAPPIVHDVLRSPGRPLDTATRAFMEPRFGHDFSDVRVHTDAHAAESARAVNALAYTVGSEIVFAPGRFSTATSSGRRLLAHELAHVVQQGTHANGVQAKLTVGDVADPAEAEADRMAAAVEGNSSPATPPKVSSISGPVLHRVEGPCEDVPAGHPLITRGSVHPAVREAQRKLNGFHQSEVDAGRPGPADAPLVEDCIFGDHTFNATLSFQQQVFADDVREHDGKIGDHTWEKLDSSSPVSPTCADSSSVNADHDPLPLVPAPKVTLLPADQVLEKVKELKPPGQRLPNPPPLGATSVRFASGPVAVQAVPAADSTCMKCVAEWSVVPQVESFVAVGTFSDEPKRFAAIRAGDSSGCPPSPIPDLLEVRKVILPEAVPFITAAELEHHFDFVRAFRVVGGRYLANVARLTPDRTHLRGKDVGECVGKVGRFLSAALGLGNLADVLAQLNQSFLKFYPAQFEEDFTDAYNLPARDVSAHRAIPEPANDRAPTFPNIDLEKNPFGCTAFARKFSARSFPGIPGTPSDQAIPLTVNPPLQVWHEL